MTARHPTRHALVLAAFCSFASAPALAADRSGSAERLYQQERAACLSGRTHQDQATCLREAGAALEEARRGRLATPNTDYMANALQRCEVLPAGDRADCKARVAGYGSQSGSVEGGGIYRETVTRSVQLPPPAVGSSGTAEPPGSASGMPAGSAPGVPPQPALPPPVARPEAPR